VRGLWQTEGELRQQGFEHIAGVDEAGRGPLAGPVVAAAVMLPEGCRLSGLGDSKTLTAKTRERVFELIWERAVAVGVGVAEAGTVDRVNVLEATLLAMRGAIDQLRPRPDMVLVDGRTVPDGVICGRAIVGGDRSCAAIAAASVVAKVARDRMMRELDERYPGYGFVQHKGYATREHLSRLDALGPCPEHRVTFAPVRALVQGRLAL
jgi:ribonuclease HII